jgi:hypothetical protein
MGYNNPVLGPLYLVTYIFLVAILFLNLLIAILNYTFNYADKKGILNYYESIIVKIRRLEFNSEVFLILK